METLLGNPREEEGNCIPGGRNKGLVVNNCVFSVLFWENYIVCVWGTGRESIKVQNILDLT